MKERCCLYKLLHPPIHLALLGPKWHGVIAALQCGCRPYKRLQKYHFAEDRKALQWKMQTRKQMQCDGLHCRSQATLGHYR